MADDPREFCPLTGKLIHDTPQKAARVAANQRRFGKPTESFRCRACNFWHTGRSRNTKINKKRRRPY